MFAGPVLHYSPESESGSIICHDRGGAPAPYLDPAISLEQRLGSAFRQCLVSEPVQQQVLDRLAALKAHHRLTYEHSVRVGLLAGQAAAFIHEDPLIMLTSGLLHDLGKLDITLELLNKRDTWSDDDRSKMQGHVLFGYQRLVQQFPEEASAILWHHRFQDNPYPAVLPEEASSPVARTVNAYRGLLLAILDTYDASHRVNCCNGCKTIYSGDDIQGQLLKKFPQRASLIRELYEAKILTLTVFSA